MSANGGADPKPDVPASAGRQLDDSDRAPERDRGGNVSDSATQASAPIKERLFAHPDLPGAREPAASSSCSTRRRRKGGFETYRNYFSRPFGLDPSKVRLRRLKVGSRVIGGTILGPRGPDGRRQGRRTWTSRSARPARARRGSTRSRSSTAGSCSRPPRSTAPAAATCSTATTSRRLLDRPDPAAAEAAAREARAVRRAHRGLRLRPRRHPVRPDRPARARHARLPRRVRAEADRHLAQVRPRVLHELRQRLAPLLRATRSTSRRSTASRSSATRSPAGSRSRPCAG